MGNHINKDILTYLEISDDTVLPAHGTKYTHIATRFEKGLC